MGKTLCIFVNCSREKSRHDASLRSMASFVTEDRNKHLDLMRDTIVFDNGSTYPGACEALVERFDCPVYHSERNLGYWSALAWVLKLSSTHDYVYVIESDHTHYALEKLRVCEQALESIPQLGSVRVQEYSVSDGRLYNKDAPCEGSRPYAWVTHVNKVTGEPVTLVRSPVNDVWLTNFLTCLHSVNRLTTMQEVFLELSQLDKFSEHDFQSLYHYRYPTVGVLDGGMFHAKLGFGFNDANAVTGSWTDPKKLREIDYRPTRNDSVRSYRMDEITRLK